MFLDAIEVASITLESVRSCWRKGDSDRSLFQGDLRGWKRYMVAQKMLAPSVACSFKLMFNE